NPGRNDVVGYGPRADVDRSVREDAGYGAAAAGGRGVGPAEDHAGCGALDGELAQPLGRADVSVEDGLPVARVDGQVVPLSADAGSSGERAVLAVERAAAGEDYVARGRDGGCAAGAFVRVDPQVGLQPDGA